MSATLSESEFAMLINAPADELLGNIGLSRGRGAIGRDVVELGREMYVNLRNAVQSAICTNDKIRAAHNEAKSGVLVILLAALVDVIAGYLTGLSAASFCVLLLREGLAEYCLATWSKPLSV